MPNVLTDVLTPCNDSHMNTNTTTATSAYGTVREVTVTAKGKSRMVHTPSGVLLGDVEGMERLGWEFSA